MRNNSFIVILLTIALISCDKTLDKPGVTLDHLLVTVDSPHEQPKTISEDYNFNTFVTSVEAIGTDGKRFSFTGFITVNGDPGTIHPNERYQYMKNGLIDKVSLRFKNAYSNFRIIAVEEGMKPIKTTDEDNPFGTCEFMIEDDGNDYSTTEDPRCVNECENSKDDDGDGLIDRKGDLGCNNFYYSKQCSKTVYIITDGDEKEGSYAMGMSEILPYEAPSLTTVQKTDNVKCSALDGSRPIVKSGVMYVTKIDNNGFYVTDVMGTEFNHMFVFSFNRPENLYVGDRLCWLSGGVSEYNGFTEMNFPTWSAANRVTLTDEEIEQGVKKCDKCPSAYKCLEGSLNTFCAPDTCDELTNLDEPLPTPVTIESSDFKSSTALEPFEAGLIHVEDLKVGKFFDCDKSDDPSTEEIEGYCVGECNGDGEVGGQDEWDCQKKCLNDELGDGSICCEEATYHTYGQWCGSLDSGSGEKISVFSGETVLTFDPYAQEGEIIESLSGSLRHLSFGKPPWIIVPRGPSDLILETVNE